MKSSQNNTFNEIMSAFIQMLYAVSEKEKSLVRYVKWVEKDCDVSPINIDSLWEDLSNLYHNAGTNISGRKSEELYAAYESLITTEAISELSPLPQWLKIIFKEVIEKNKDYSGVNKDFSSFSKLAIKYFILFSDDEDFQKIVYLFFKENEDNFDLLIKRIFQFSKTDNFPIQKMILPILKFSLDNYHISIFVFLKENADPVHYRAACELLNADQKNILLRIETRPSFIQDTNYVGLSMQEFIHGFGKITYEGGLLVLLQTKLRKEKSYFFNPTILNGLNSLEEWLSLILNARLENPAISLNEKFIVTGKHWISGELKVEGGAVKIFFIDPLGPDYLTTLNPSIFFENKNIPYTIYISHNERQRAVASCQVFALDDLRHLYTVERYLPERYINSGLFGFLEDHQVNVKGRLKISALPLSLLRTTQTKSVFEEIRQRPIEEQKIPAKKSKETAIASTESFFKNNINVRIEQQLNKMASEVFNLLISYSKNQITEMTRTFTLDGFKERLNIMKNETSVSFRQS